MKKIEKEIRTCKCGIEAKKTHLRHDYEWLKDHLASSKGISLATLGGFMIGFLLLPKKFKILKGLFKTYTIATTLKQIVDAIPRLKTDSPDIKTKEKDNKNSKVYHIK